MLQILFGQHSPIFFVVIIVLIPDSGNYVKGQYYNVEIVAQDSRENENVKVLTAQPPVSNKKSASLAQGILSSNLWENDEFLEHKLAMQRTETQLSEWYI